MSEAEREARALLAEYAAVRDEYNGDWALLLDAANRALKGDATAAPTLMRVFTEPGFAVSNSCNETGVAALGLALLGRVDVVEHLRPAPRINFNREAIPLALKLCAEKR